MPSEPAFHDKESRNGHNPAASSRCSVGMMAYNEEANIGAALRSILEQPTLHGAVEEVVVVASGCEDRTAAIVADIAAKDWRVRLIEQPRREGKASAINLFLGIAQSPLLLLVSADVVVADGSLDALVRHFDDPTVGMVGGHPTPVNDESTFLGHAVHLQWRLHDRLARRWPKLGELVAFRNIVPGIPVDTAVDEISIQALVTQLGYRLVYEPQAVVYNRGPATMADFLRQRRRIYAGHLRIRERQGYAAPTMNVWRIARELLRSDEFGTPNAALWTIGTVGLEGLARLQGHYDVALRRPQHVWQIAATTKTAIAEGIGVDLQQNVLVFHIVGFQRRQLDAGGSAARHVMQRVARHVERALGAKAVVSIERSGTIVALMPGDRQTAESAARALVERFRSDGVPADAHVDGPPLTLACGVISFADSGPPLASSIAGPLLETAQVLDPTPLEPQLVPPVSR